MCEFVFYKQDALVLVFMVTAVINPVQIGVQNVDVTLPTGLVSVANLDGQVTPVTQVKNFQCVVNKNYFWIFECTYEFFLYVSNLCYTECPPGSFGLNCSTICTGYCRDPCNHISGICDSGCLDGWLGQHCKQCKQVYLYGLKKQMCYKL